MFANAHELIGRLYLLQANCDAISYVIKKNYQKGNILDLIITIIAQPAHILLRYVLKIEDAYYLVSYGTTTLQPKQIKLNYPRLEGSQKSNYYCSKIAILTFQLIDT